MKRLIIDYINKKYNENIRNSNCMLIERTSIDELKAFVESLHPIAFPGGLIRLGSEGDGGYLVPDDLQGIKACFSPGVDINSDFEVDCYRRGMDIYLADYSVGSPRIDDAIKYKFIKKFLGSKSDRIYITLDSWVDQQGLDDDSDLILQMDIEGAEYEVILNITDKLLKRFRIIILELHDLQNLWNPAFFKFAKSAIGKLIDTHACVHIHPNNNIPLNTEFGFPIPPIAEFTFLRRDRIKHFVYSREFPHALDFDNSSSETIFLPKEWYNYK